ncbi:7-cyano-7-deazaguanine synthase QueC [bacterium]|nr:7-cyano-7-deazaguanine synthase QueC [bacterium]RQV94424.1 MAG: 7-cyano-7-deazaguanine synthase QueC [bacterium]
MAGKAVVLLSGGIDSTTTLGCAKAEGYHLYALSFRYGQRNQFEIEAARRVARSMSVKDHLILTIDLASIGGSALTTEIPVPKERSEEEMSQHVPVTYVPARNTIFLSFALSWAESLGASDIFIGVNVLDYSGYPDCRPQFIEAFEKMANLGTRAGVEGQRIRVHTPLIQMTKSQIIQKGHELGIDYGMTQSCYDPSPDGKACGQCDSCLLREKGFREAGIPDPTQYVV